MPRRSDEEIQREIDDPRTTATRRAYLKYKLMKRRLRNSLTLNRIDRNSANYQQNFQRNFVSEFNPEESDEYIDLVPWRNRPGYVYGSKDLLISNEEDQDEFIPLNVTSASLSEEFIKESTDESCQSDWTKTNCISCKSPVSLEEYTDKDNVISFKIYDTNKKKFGKGQCIAKDELKQMLQSGNSIFSIWEGGDSSGHGGKPTKNMVVKLTVPSTIYVTLDSAHKIFHSSINVFYAIALYGGKRRRVGNVAGRIGVSENHGQLPGFQIYKLFSQEEIQKGTEANLTANDFKLQFQICDQMENLVDMFQDTTNIRDFLLHQIVKYITISD